MTAHIGELKLRRFHVGELAGEAHDEVSRHTTSCPDCRERLEALADEQAAFAKAIPFERFAGGVERAVRVPRRPRFHLQPGTMVRAGTLLFAAAAALVLVARPAPQQGSNGIKGGLAISNYYDATLRIAQGDGSGQRPLAAGMTTQLAAGERLRIGYQSPTDAYLAVVSVDDQGAVTPLYPESGTSLPVTGTTGIKYLPESVELTGNGGERIFLLFADRPFAMDGAAGAARASFTAAGRRVSAMQLPVVPGTTITGFTWLLFKP